jgi:hypothetical protein
VDTDPGAHALDSHAAPRQRNPPTDASVRFYPLAPNLRIPRPHPKSRGRDTRGAAPAQTVRAPEHEPRASRKRRLCRCHTRRLRLGHWHDRRSRRCCCSRARRRTASHEGFS